MADWQKIFATVHSAAQTVVTIKQGYDSATILLSIVDLDRDAAIERLHQHVETLTPQQFDEFEIAFVNFGATVVDRMQRIRMMELYVSLKLLETQKFGQWRGFVNWS